MLRFFFIFISFTTILFSQSKNENEINDLLDNWHLAAARADEDVFFDFTMAEEGIYIGTDSSELWTRDELKEWSAEYFERESAWDFTPLSRNIYFSKNKKVAWFDELLETWMGTCRGSGVLEKHKGKWQLKHYHLAIAVPNDVVKEYLELIQK